MTTARTNTQCTQQALSSTQRSKATGQLSTGYESKNSKASAANSGGGGSSSQAVGAPGNSNGLVTIASSKE